VGGSVSSPDLCEPKCGDGIIVSPIEPCDDGNTASGDGCSGICRAIETGNSCVGAPSICTPICGDGLRVGTEMCDD
jgi:cysteine-rich repeat protein